MDTQDIGAALARQEEQIKGLARRMDNLEKLTESVNKLAISVERLTAQQAATDTQIETLTGDVNELKDKPAKRWDLVVTALIRAIRTFAQTFVGFIAVGAALEEVQWLRALSVSGAAAVLSILTSLATGLPEVDPEHEPPDSEIEG